MNACKSKFLPLFHIILGGDKTIPATNFLENLWTIDPAILEILTHRQRHLATLVHGLARKYDLKITKPLMKMRTALVCICRWIACKLYILNIYSDIFQLETDK